MKEKRMYSFRPKDFIPLYGARRYVRRSYSANFANGFGRGLLIGLYNSFVIAGASYFFINMLKAK